MAIVENRLSRSPAAVIELRNDDGWELQSFCFVNSHYDDLPTAAGNERLRFLVLDKHSSGQIQSEFETRVHALRFVSTRQLYQLAKIGCGLISAGGCEQDRFIAGGFQQLLYNLRRAQIPDLVTMSEKKVFKNRKPVLFIWWHRKRDFSFKQ